MSLRVPWLAGSCAVACGAANGTVPAEAKPKAAESRPRPATARGPAAIVDGNVERTKKVWEAAAGGFGRAVAVSRAANRVAASSGSPVRLYELATGKPQGKISTCSEVLRSGMIYEDGRLWVACANRLEAYDAKSGSSVPAPKIHASEATAAAFAWPKLALGHRDGVVRVYDLDGGATAEIPVPGPPIDVKSLALTPDGSKVAVAWIQGSIWWWDVAVPSVPHELVRHPSESDTVAFSDDGRLLAEEGETKQTTVWAFSARPAEAFKIKNGDWVKRLLFTSDSRWLVRGGSDGLELAEVAGPRRVVLDTRGKVEDVALDEHASTLAAIDRDGRLTTWAVR